MAGGIGANLRILDYDPEWRYARAKTALVQELTDRARAEHGLPPEPVWEKP
jgi:hypothetical protein